MSRVFTDDGLMTWEAFASGGAFGLPHRANIIFHCLSDPDRRARSLQHEGGNAAAEHVVQSLSDGELKDLLQRSTELR
jgi:hypothetical protein